MTTNASDIPDDFILPPLPKAIDEWFTFVGSLHDAELIHDGAILDGLQVVDTDSARRALEGYRFVNEGNGWIDAVQHRGWDANWIVLDSINADPLIADISTPQVAVLEARHGQGAWKPTTICDSVHEFITGLEVARNVPEPPAEDPVFDHSVWLTDLGPEPKRTLLRLQKWPMFPRLTRAELLRLHERLPMVVLDEVTETVAHNAAEWASAQGIPVEVHPKT